jgi:hypothetical protein
MSLVNINLKKSDKNNDLELKMLLKEYNMLHNTNLYGGNTEEAEPASTKLQYMNPSKMTTYTIKRGTILYHASTTKETFNPFVIKLGENGKLVAFFTPNRDHALSYIKNCTEFPEERGFIHMFKVNEDITDIMIVSPYDTNFTLENIENNFCSRTHDPLLNGVGIFYPKEGVSYDTESKIAESEFALCHPNSKTLSYVGTYSCNGRAKLSTELSNFVNGQILIK